LLSSQFLLGVANVITRPWRHKT